MQSGLTERIQRVLLVHVTALLHPYIICSYLTLPTESMVAVAPIINFAFFGKQFSMGECSGLEYQVTTSNGSDLTIQKR